MYLCLFWFESNSLVGVSKTNELGDMSKDQAKVKNHDLLNHSMTLVTWVVQEAFQLYTHGFQGCS